MMVKFRIKKAFIGTEENKTFKPNQTHDFTLERAKAIQKNIDAQHPDYGEVLERVKDEENPKEKPKG